MDAILGVILNSIRDFGISFAVWFILWMIIRRYTKTMGSKVYFSFFVIFWSVAATMRLISDYIGTEVYVMAYVIASTINGIVVVSLVIWVRKTIIKPVQQFAKMGEVVGTGNFRVDIPDSKEKDEIGQILRAFHFVLEFLKGVIGESKEIAASLGSISEQLASSAEEVNSSSESIAISQQQISKGANNQVNAISDILSKIQKLNEGMKNISQQLSSVDEISDSINSISEQTNMLALNAAIEAARAGEAGKGFSVVSEQIRKLSEESQRAVKNSVENVQHIKSTILIQERNTADMVKNIEAISVVSEEVSASTEESAAAAQEQAASMEQINSIAQTMLIHAEKLQKQFDKIQI